MNKHVMLQFLILNRRQVNLGKSYLLKFTRNACLNECLKINPYQRLKFMFSATLRKVKINK